MGKPRADTRTVWAMAHKDWRLETMVKGSDHVKTIAPAGMLDAIKEVRAIMASNERAGNILSHATACFTRVKGSNGNTVDPLNVPGFSSMVSDATTNAAKAYADPNEREGALPG